MEIFVQFLRFWACLRHRLRTPFLRRHLSLNHGGRWGTTDDFTTSFLRFSLFSTALWDLTNSRPVHSLVSSSRLLFCLPCLLFLPFALCFAIWVWPDLMNGRHVHTTAVCISFIWSGGLRVLRLPLDLGKTSSLVTWSLYEMRSILR